MPQEHGRNEAKTECQHKMKLKFFFNLIVFFTRSFNHQGSRISYSLVWRGLVFSFNASVSGLGFSGEGVTLNTPEKQRPVINHFDSPV